MKSLFLLMILFGVSAALANETVVDRKALDSSYTCSNGGTLTLVPTRINNIKRLIFSKPGSLNQNAYVHFWSQKIAQFKGYLYVSVTIPELGQGETSIEGRPYAEMQVTNDGQKNVISVTPFKWTPAPPTFSGFTCRAN